MNQKINLQKNNFGIVLKKISSNYLFLLVTFINVFLPLFYTIISALTTGANTYFNIIGVGLSTSFVSVFNQFLFWMAAAIVFKYKEQRTNNILLNRWEIKKNTSSYLIMLVFCFIAMACFVLTSCLYVYFNTSYKNIRPAAYESFKFESFIIFSLLFNGFTFLSLVTNWEKHKKFANLLLSTYFLLNLILVPVFTLYIPWNPVNQIFGIGLGSLIASFISFMISMIYLIIEHQKHHISYKFEKEEFKSFFSKVSNQTIDYLMTTFLKVIIVISIACGLGLNGKDTPLDMAIAKIIWYHCLYFVAFFTDGFILSAQYTMLQEYEKKSVLLTNKKQYLYISLILTTGTLIITIIFGFCADGLAGLYSSSRLSPDYLAQHPQIFETGKSGIPKDWYLYTSGGNFISKQMVQGYLWSAPNGIANYKLALIKYPNGLDSISINNIQTTNFSMMYIFIARIFMSSIKGLTGLKPIKVDQKFSWKKILMKVAMIGTIIVILILFVALPGRTLGFIKSFPGLDSFSFPIMIVGIIMAIVTFSLFFKKPKNKDNKNKNKINTKK